MKFTESHEWIELEEGDIVRIGITDYAQKELGDIVYVELPILDRQVQAGQEVVVLESTKAAADVYSPVSGTILETNRKLNEHPEWVNQSPEQEGWLFKMKMSDKSEWEKLMSQTDYEVLVGQS